MTPSMMHPPKNALWIVVAMAVFFSACAPKQEALTTANMEEWKARVETSRPHSPSATKRDLTLPEATPPPEAQKTQEAPEPVPEERPLPTQKVTMSMRNTDVNVILRALAQVAAQNIMMNESVKGVTQINVQETPWDQVFRAVLRTRGLTYIWEEDIIRVMSIEDLRHDKDIEDLQQQRQAQKMESKKVEPLLTKVIPLNFYAMNQLKDFSSTKGSAPSATDKKTVAELFEKLLSESVDEKGQSRKLGSVTPDLQTNSLIVHAIKEDIANIVALLEQLDRPTTQVLLEAHIIETSKETARELGIQWGGLYRGSSTPGTNNWITAGANAFSGGGPTNTITTAVNPLVGPMVNMPADLTSMTAATGLTLGFIHESVGNYLLNVQLSALEEANKVHILSSPSITTLDNQTAVIESGRSVPYQTTEGTGTDKTVTIVYKDATLRLEVTPHVIDKEMLKLMIIINKDEVDFSNTVEGSPTIIKKTAMTNLILNDGATTVIGGLTKETGSNSDNGIPGLKDIPGLGYLFKNRGDRNEMEDVLIFITPHILKEKGTPPK